MKQAFVQSVVHRVCGRTLSLKGGLRVSGTTWIMGGRLPWESRGTFQPGREWCALFHNPAALQEQTPEQSVDTSEWLLPISETLGWRRKSMWTRDLFWSQDQEDPLTGGESPWWVSEGRESRMTLGSGSGPWVGGGETY